MRFAKEVTGEERIGMKGIYAGGNGSVKHRVLMRYNTKEGDMRKKLSLLVAIGIGLTGLWCGHANAWPASSSGWYVKTGSIDVTSDWVQISNTDLKPTDIVVSIYPTVVVYYKNPSGNDGGVGTPFTLNVPLVGLDELDGSLVGRGKASSTISFPDITLAYLNSLGIDLSVYAPNPQWEAYDVKITGLDVKIQAYEDVSSYCTPSNTPTSDWTSCYHNSEFDLYEEEVVHLEGLCSLQGTIYTCVESEHWEYSKKDPFWP